MSASEKLQGQILARLDVLSRLLAFQVVMPLKSKQQQVEVLHNVGFSNREIAELLDVKYATVGVTLFNIKQAKVRRKAKQARRSKKVKK
jgi:DNA-directed RNA polymerase specialized sigma24 family protein